MGVHQHLGATCKCWLTPKHWLTPGENTIFFFMESNKNLIASLNK